MSETIATEKAVFEAADRLTAKKDRVSNLTIQAAIGGGSKNTICPLLRRWRELRKVIPESSQEPPPLPDPVLEAIKEVVARLRQAAQMDAKEKIDAASTVLAAKLAIAAAELDSAIVDCDEVDAELRVVTSQRDKLAQERTEIVTLNAQLQQQVGDAQARASAAEMREGELRKHAEDLKSELATSHRMHDEERERSNQLRNAIAQMRIDLDTNALVLANAVGDANHARLLAAEAKERSEKAEATATTRIDAMAAECEQARRDAKEKGELAAGLQRELVAVKQKSDDFYALIKGEKSRIGKSAGKRAKSNVN